jgi:hypothetical protein
MPDNVFKFNIEKHLNIIDYVFLDNGLIPGQSCLKKYKKEQIVNSGVFDCKPNYFYAYVNIRSDGYCNLDFRHKYEVGKICSTSKTRASGLNAETKDRLLRWCTEKIIKVKIYYNDVTRFSADGSVITTKLTVVE